MRALLDKLNAAKAALAANPADVNLQNAVKAAEAEILAAESKAPSLPARASGWMSENPKSTFLLGMAAGAVVTVAIIKIADHYTIVPVV